MLNKNFDGLLSTWPSNFPRTIGYSRDCPPEKITRRRMSPLKEVDPSNSVIGTRLGKSR